MTNNQPDIVDAASRERLYPYLIGAFPIMHRGETLVEAPYLEAMCYELERVAQGETRRLLITVPPRHLKSLTASVAFVAWLLGRDPRKEILVASYSEELVRVHSLACHDLIRHRAYRRLFPHVAFTRERDLVIRTTSGGGRAGL